MAKYPPLTVKRMLSVDGGNTYKPWEECSEEEIKLFQEVAPRKFEKSITDYLNAHPEEMERIASSKN